MLLLSNEYIFWLKVVGIIRSDFDEIDEDRKILSDQRIGEDLSSSSSEKFSSDDIFREKNENKTQSQRLFFLEFRAEFCNVSVG